MSNPSVKDICKGWIDNGLGDECFWESCTCWSIVLV